MKLKGIAIVALVCVAVGAFTFDAAAQQGQGTNRNPSALLLYPHYNSVKDPGIAVITITNTCPDDIWVRFVWIDTDACDADDDWWYLTGYETLTFIDYILTPKTEEGFLYVYVVEDDKSIAEKGTNCLIGQEMIFQPDFPGNIFYAINAVGFQALNVNGDGDLHLNGIEYTQAPSKVYFPRFFGQNGPANIVSEFIIINLTGGQWFDADADVLIYNDEEDSVSSNVIYDCYDRLDLYETFENPVDNTWMDNWSYMSSGMTDDYGMIGYEDQETGWIEILGDLAWNPDGFAFFTYASLYAVLIEAVSGFGGADLPWSEELPDHVIDATFLWSDNPDGT